MLPIERPTAEPKFAASSAIIATPSLDAQENGYIYDPSGKPQIPIMKWDNWRAQLYYQWQQQYKNELNYLTAPAHRWRIDFNAANANGGIGSGVNPVVGGAYVLGSALETDHSYGVAFGPGCALKTTGALGDYAYIKCDAQHDLLSANSIFRFAGAFCESSNVGMLVGLIDPTLTPPDPDSDHPFGGNTPGMAIWYNPTKNANLQLLVGATTSSSDGFQFDLGITPPTTSGHFISTPYEFFIRNVDMVLTVFVYQAGVLVGSFELTQFTGGFVSPFFGVKALDASVKRLRLQSACGERVTPGSF